MAIDPSRVACVVLAAGRSERFGGEDKLAALLGGRPLLHHALATLDRFPFAAKLAVCRTSGPGMGETGFARVCVSATDAPQSHSLHTGLAALPEAGFDAILIALGDMPLVSTTHIAALLAHFDPADPECIVASADGARRSPPALFAVRHLPALRALKGDSGARALLKHAETVAARPGELADVDTISDLAGLSRRHHI